MTPNTDLPPSPPAEAEQGPSAGCAPTPGSLSSDTPETDECTGPCICHAVGLGDQEDACPREKMATMELQRNEAFRLLRVIEAGHRNIKSRLYYQACDTDPCEWCLQVRPLILPENDNNPSAPK